MNKTIYRLEKLSEFQKRDNDLKVQMDSLNKEISEFVSTELGVVGQATLVDILKCAMEKSIESNIITTT